MFETVFSQPRILARHEQAPLRREREQYLTHLAQQGVSFHRLQNVAAMLLNVIELMGMPAMRTVGGEEIAAAGQRWALDTEIHRTRVAGRDSARVFTDVATNWFRFLDKLTIPTSPIGYFDELIADFVYELRIKRELAPTTVDSYGWRTRRFLLWATRKCDRVSAVSLRDIEEYFDLKRAEGWTPRTIAANCNSLRAFFNHAEVRGWCAPNLAKGIHSPRVPKYDCAPKGPRWRDVQRLLRYTSGPKASEIRAHAIILLCSVYAFRSSEIANLRLEDFDWRNETLTVRRAKRGRTQQYPIQYELGEAILRYLREVRPHCACRNLFVTRYPPYRPVRMTSLGAIVARCFKNLNIESEHVGPHALRHACATQLLKKGTPLKEIADFLGHRDTKCVSIYAKYDTHGLRKVATFSLRWAQ